MTEQPFTEREPLTPAIVKMIARNAGLGAMFIGDPDYVRGAAKINDHTKCFWNKNGERITVALSNGAFTLAASRGPDPDRPEPLPSAESTPDRAERAENRP